MLQGLGIKSGVDLDKLLVASAFIDKALSNRYLLPRTYSLTHLLTHLFTHSFIHRKSNSKVSLARRAKDLKAAAKSSSGGTSSTC